MKIYNLHYMSKSIYYLRKNILSGSIYRYLLLRFKDFLGTIVLFTAMVSIDIKRMVQSSGSIRCLGTPIRVDYACVPK